MHARSEERNSQAEKDSQTAEGNSGENCGTLKINCLMDKKQNIFKAGNFK